MSLMLPLTVPATAAAAEPTRDTVTVTVTSRSLLPCPSGVVALGLFQVVREITTFYDENGQPASHLWVASLEGTITNPLSGAWLPDRGIRIFHPDLVTGAFFTTGTKVVTKLPDGGVAIGGAGRLVFEAAGNLIAHDGPTALRSGPQLCAALGA